MSTVETLVRAVCGNFEGVGGANLGYFKKRGAQLQKWNVTTTKNSLVILRGARLTQGG